VNLKISATCTRVPIVDGHTAIVNISFSDEKPSIKKFKGIIKSYTSLPQTLKLPSAPSQPIHILDDIDRPQPKIDLNNDKGMALSIGRIQKDLFFDIRFIGLSHNTLRGAAGGAILNAELLVKKKYIYY
ncbi:MAG: Asd/ArgC dimerization domain-containing protein, partial [Candidatus Neomarinimicrobiota bacterium]